MKRKHTALQMQQFVGDEKNELLDYLRSLQPEKVRYITTSNYFLAVEFLVSLQLILTLSASVVCFMLLIHQVLVFSWTIFQI